MIKACTSRGRITALVLMAMLAGSTSAFAWNDTGHSTTALVAWRELSPAMRTKLSAILKAHPMYEKDLLKDCPAGADKDEYAFYRAAVWPDMIRSGHPMSQYHRGSWHYTDVPYFPFGGEDKFDVAAPKPMKPGEPYDAVSAFEYSLRLLKSETAKPSDRAIALCWVLHIGGDVHQPLHCVSLFSEKYPTGDRGGNEEQLMKDGQPTSLHWIWDNGLGSDHSPEVVQALATEITKAHPRSEFETALKARDIRDWVNEGQAICIDKVYLYGMINTSKKGDNTTPPPMSQDYVKSMSEVCKTRGALAGYRIADTLSNVMADGGVAPGMKK